MARTALELPAFLPFSLLIPCSRQRRVRSRLPPQPLCRGLPGFVAWSHHSSGMPLYSAGFAADGYALRYRETARSPEPSNPGPPATLSRSPRVCGVVAPFFRNAAVFEECSRIWRDLRRMAIRFGTERRRGHPHPVNLGLASPMRPSSVPAPNGC